MENTSPQQTLKAAYHTLGCKLNFSETSTIARMLQAKGVVRAKEDEKADICVINTCSVTEMADKKGRQLIRRLATANPDATIVVTGCYAQLKPAEVAAIDGVDIVLGSDEKLDAALWIDRWFAEHSPITAVADISAIRRFQPSCEKGDRTRWFLKVQDGCDRFCTYCTIPLARGRSRSASIDDIVAQAENVAREGGREIVITGVNIGDFGRRNSQSFFDLVRRLDDVEGISRFRISSIEPDLLPDELIDWMASARAFMPHFHIPLQSGSDRVLKLMHRHYDTALFADRINHIRSVMPDAYIGVDVMAGTRGETAEEWERSLEFIRSLDITRLHVFPYSERPGTKALSLDNPVSQEEKHRRAAILSVVSDDKLNAFAARMTDTVRPVLWEQPRPGAPMHGFTDNYLRVETPYAAELVNTITEVRLIPTSGVDFKAESHE